MTPNEKINNPDQPTIRVLIAPLDWGLGHTTRCLPIIKTFLCLGAEVAVAGNEKQAHLLCEEIKSLRLISLEGYGLNYGRRSLTTHLKLLLQVPKILTAIKRENRWLARIANDEKFDIIISDNRYGLHHPTIFSVFITHQLRIRLPFSKWLERKLQMWNYHFINLFNECWIPDYTGQPNLAGVLSHPEQMPKTLVKYIGPLTRFAFESTHPSKKSYLLFIISGPEPQRTIFESIIENELKKYDGDAIVLRGLPGDENKKLRFGNVTFINHLPTVEFNKLMAEAEFVICRSGYSSIMDIISMQKKSILVPTPGQTEQEYLALYLMNNKLCVAIDQRDFSLKDALKTARNFQYGQMASFTQNELLPAAKDVIHRIVGKKIQVDDASR